MVLQQDISVKFKDKQTARLTQALANATNLNLDKEENFFIDIYRRKAKIFDKIEEIYIRGKYLKE